MIPWGKHLLAQGWINHGFNLTVLLVVQIKYSDLQDLQMNWTQVEGKHLDFA